MTRTIREYTSEYRKQMEDICLATASEKARTDILHGIFTLKMYCDLYLDHGEVLMLVDEKNQAAGYVMAAYKMLQMLGTDAEIIVLGEYYKNRAEAEWNGYLTYADRYPAHVHIDLLESETGSGNGTRLMKAMLEKLKSQNVKGVMLGVARANERAVKFYQKMGFQVLEQDEGGYAMGIRLQETA